jgi:hypothetical protein
MLLLRCFVVLLWSQDFRGVIKRCKSVILVAQAMPELAAVDFHACSRGEVEIPAVCRRNIAFLRAWCLVRFIRFSRVPSVCLFAVPPSLLKPG